MDLIIFTDGSCRNNGKSNACAGYGVLYPNKEYENVSEPFTIKPITNQRANYMRYIWLSRIVLMILTTKK